MDAILKLQAFLLQHLTLAEALILGLIVDGLIMIFAVNLLLFLVRARLRIARLFRLISEEKYQQSLQKKLRSIAETRNPKKVRKQRWVLAAYGAFILFVVLSMGFSLRWQSGEAIKSWQQGTIGPLEARINKISVKFLKGKDIRDMCIGLVNGEGVYSTCFSQGPSGDSFPLDDTTIFEIGSITKTFTYAAMLRVLAKHHLDLNSTIGPFLPQHVLAKNPGLAKISWRQLATHTSGLSNLPYSVTDRTLLRGTMRAILAEHLLNNPYEYLGQDYVFEYLASAALDENSPKPFHYSNLGVGLLGFLLSEMEGESFQELIENKVLSPLNMTSTAAGLAVDSDKAIAGYAQYRRLGPIVVTAQVAPWIFPNVMAGAGGITAPLGDMVIYLKSRMEQYKEPWFHDPDHAVSLDGGDNGRINLGWFVAPLPKNKGDHLVFHNGRTGGFQSFLGFNDSKQVGVVILTNGTRDVTPLGAGLVTLLTEAGGLPKLVNERG